MGRRTSRGRRGDRSSRKIGSGCKPLSSTGSSSPPWDWRARRSAEDSVAGGPPGVRGDSSRSCAGMASPGSSGSSSDLSSGDEPSIWSSATGRESRGRYRMAAVAVARYGHRPHPFPGTSATTTVRMTRPRVSTCPAPAPQSSAVPSSVCRRRDRSRGSVWKAGYSRQPVDPASDNPSTTRSSVGAGDTAVTSWPSPGDMTRTPVASRP